MDLTSRPQICSVPSKTSSAKSQTCAALPQPSSVQSQTCEPHSQTCSAHPILCAVQPHLCANLLAKQPRQPRQTKQPRQTTQIRQPNICFPLHLKKTNRKEANHFASSSLHTNPVHLPKCLIHKSL